MRLALRVTAGLLTLMVAALALGQIGLLAGRAPSDLGVNEGRLKAPSPTANSVSSQTTLYPDHPQIAHAAIEPLPLMAGDANASLRALTDVLTALPGVSVVEQGPDYIRAEAQTRWLKFVDDLEFWVNPQRQAIEVRSASRLGRKDFGVNRQRVETIRQAYLAQP